VFAWGAILAGLWIAGLFSARLRARGWAPAGALTLAFLLPVLPLGNHTYHYYLYAPLAGAAWCVAAAFDALLDRRAALGLSAGRETRRAIRREPGSGRSPGSAGRGAFTLVLGIVIAAGLTAN